MCQVPKRHLQRALLVPYLTALTACTSPNAPDPNNIREIRPAVRSMEGRVSGDFVAVQLELDNPAYVVGENDRIPVDVVASSGDAEVLLARKTFCEHPNWGTVACGMVVMRTRPGHLPDIEARLQRYDAYVVSANLGGRFVTAYFPYGTVQSILETTQSWPEVELAEPSGIVKGAAVPNNSGPEPVTIIGTIRMGDPPAVRENRLLESVLGDTLVFDYDAAGGSVTTSITH